MRLLGLMSADRVGTGKTGATAADPEATPRETAGPQGQSLKKEGSLEREEGGHQLIDDHLQEEI